MTHSKRAVIADLRSRLLSVHDRYIRYVCKVADEREELADQLEHERNSIRTETALDIYRLVSAFDHRLGVAIADKYDLWSEITKSGLGEH